MAPLSVTIYFVVVVKVVDSDTDMQSGAWPGECTSEELNSAEVSKESTATSIHMPSSSLDVTFVPAPNYAIQTGERDCLDPFMWLPWNLSETLLLIIHLRN